MTEEQAVQLLAHTAEIKRLLWVSIGASAILISMGILWGKGK